MKKNFRNFMIVILVMSLGLFLWGEKKAFQAVPILAYHEISSDDEPYGISPEAFEEEMRYLKEQGYYTISLKEFFEAKKQGQALPEKAIIITFDDGYRNNLTEALPIAKKYDYTFTVFMIAGKIGQDNFLNRSELLELQQQGVEIGSHTVNHLALAELGETEKRQELQQSKLSLEQQLNQKVEFLAYPFGSLSTGISQQMAEAEYAAGLTGKPGLNDAQTPPYLLKRINMPRPKYGLWEFRLRLWRSQALYVWQSMINH